jgi:N-acetyl-anhydromuramyl-L-alanine amidase AmpD
MTDYIGAIWMPNSNFFPNTGKKSFVILHGTAGGSSALEIASYFQGTEGTSNPVSSHYIVGQDGTVVQCVSESNGAYGNGVVTNSNWTGNPNDYTISIEHVKPDTENATALTPAQQAASFALIKNICQRNGIGMYDATDTTGITGHFSIDPVNRANCPGTFPWDALWAYLQGGTPVNNTPTAYQTQAANDSWNSVLKNMAAGPAPTGTGIYNVWLSALINGTFYGPPITREYATIDWSGNAIVVQEFAHARCEWSIKNGLIGWYNESGKLS